MDPFVGKNMIEGSPARGSVPAFLTKLWRIVCDENYNDLISWSENGTTIRIHQSIEFSQKILPLFYKHNNFSSFVRQVNMYGFRKIADIGGSAKQDGEWEFYHPCFQRDHPERINMMKRKSHMKEEVKQSVPQIGNILQDVEKLKNHNDIVDDKLTLLKSENERLWAEVFDLRERHTSQQAMIVKLIQFFLQLVMNKTDRPRKRRYGGENEIQEKAYYQNRALRYQDEQKKKILQRIDSSSSSAMVPVLTTPTTEPLSPYDRLTELSPASSASPGKSRSPDSVNSGGGRTLMNVVSKEQIVNFVPKEATVDFNSRESNFNFVSTEPATSAYGDPFDITVTSMPIVNNISKVPVVNSSPKVPIVTSTPKVPVSVARKVADQDSASKHPVRSSAKVPVLNSAEVPIVNSTSKKPVNIAPKVPIVYSTSYQPIINMVPNVPIVTPPPMPVSIGPRLPIVSTLPQEAIINMVPLSMANVGPQVSMLNPDTNYVAMNAAPEVSIVNPIPQQVIVNAVTREPITDVLYKEPILSFDSSVNPLSGVNNSSIVGVANEETIGSDEDVIVNVVDDDVVLNAVKHEDVGHSKVSNESHSSSNNATSAANSSYNSTKSPFIFPETFKLDTDVIDLSYFANDYTPSPLSSADQTSIVKKLAASQGLSTPVVNMPSALTRQTSFKDREEISTNVDKISKSIEMLQDMLNRQEINIDLKNVNLNSDLFKLVQGQSEEGDASDERLSPGDALHGGHSEGQVIPYSEFSPHYYDGEFGVGPGDPHQDLFNISLPEEDDVY